MVSRAKAAQRKRRRGEAKLAEEKLAEEVQHHSSEEEDDEPDVLDITWVLPDDDDEEIPIPHQIAEYIELEVADSSDEEECDDAFVHRLFPLFIRPFDTTKKKVKRFKKNGESLTKYKHPITNPDTSSTKLVSRPLPRSTKHDWKKKREKAIGASNNIMSNWLKPTPASVQGDDTSQSSSSDSTDHFTSTDDEDSESQSEDRDSGVEERLEAIHQKYLNAPRPTPKSDRLAQIEEQWADLDSAITAATVEYQRHSKEVPAQITTQLDEIREFNYRRRELAHCKSKSPSINASILTAQSSLRRRPPKKGIEFSSGVSRAKKIRAQAHYLLAHKALIPSNQGYGSPHKSMLDDTNVVQAIRDWIAPKRTGEITARRFRQHVNEIVLPQSGYTKTISIVTVYLWMSKVGLRAQEYKKGLYFDGHERPDVVQYRNKYLEDVLKLQSRSQKYDETDLLVSLPLDPSTLDGQRETIFIYHDESTIHANEAPSRAWVMPNTTELRTKNSGRLIHISDFVLQSYGRLAITDEIRASSGVSIPADTPDDAAVVICPGANGDKWWDMAQLTEQVCTKAIPIFNSLHPECQAVFVFDCSAAHAAYGPSALRINKVNLNPGGKQGLLRDTIIPSDDPNIPPELRGKPQSMVFPLDHPNQKLAGKAKGGKQILIERGLWAHHLKIRGTPLAWKCPLCQQSGLQQDAIARATRILEESQADPIEPGLDDDEVDARLREDCCASKVLSCQSDFKNEKPLLQTVIEEAGHICLFLPKFHPELNPIELVWAYIKTDYRAHNFETRTFKEKLALFHTVRKRCPLLTIRKFFRKIDRQHSAYRQGIIGPQGQKLVNKVYRSHRQIPRSAAMRIDVIAET